MWAIQGGLEDSHTATVGAMFVIENYIYCKFHNSVSAFGAQEKTRGLGSCDFTWNRFSAQISVPYGDVLLPP